MSLATLMFTTVDIETEAVTKTATGGTSIGWTSKATAVAAKVDNLGGQAIMAYGRLGYTATDKVIFNADQSLTIKDRILFEGSQYLVRSTQHFKGGSIEYWEAVCERKPL